MNMIVSTAALASATAVAAGNIDAGPDAYIIEAGKTIEALLGKYLDAKFEWARLHREARAAMDAKFPKGADDSDGRHPKWKFLRRMLEENGADKADDRMCAISDQMEPFAEQIRDAEPVTIGGLRAKMLVAMRDCLPISARHDGLLEFDDERSHASLFFGAASLTGLSDMLSSLCERLQADATIAYEDEA